MDCLFCKIAAGQIPASILYEDDKVVAFHDIDPQAPVHFLLIPRQHIPGPLALDDSHQALAGQLLLSASRLAREHGCEQGFRLVMNCNDLGGQTVHHLHLHVLGQRQLHWPPG